MDNQLIEKVIKCNNEPCPDFTYENPLLDKDVVRKLSKSFVKILNISKQNSVNNNVRLSVIENIRKLCQIEPKNHAKVNENFTEILSEFYQDQIATRSIPENPTDKMLDAFLVRKTKEWNTSSSYESTLNPEIVQAMLNLHNNGIHLDKLSQDIIHWDITNRKWLSVLTDMWNNNDFSRDISPNFIFDDVAIQMRPEIEKLLLEISHRILSNRDIDVEHTFLSNDSITNLVKTCSNSPDCFQISYSILNFLFITTNFDQQIQKLISIFVKQVKRICPHVSFAVMYPLRLSSVMILVDIEIKDIPFKDQYIPCTLSYLQNLHKESEMDLILVLSHYPQWFDIYFSQE